MFHFVAKINGEKVIGIWLETQAAVEQMRQRFEQNGYQVEVTEE